jgi:hypothetical protein
MTLYRTQSITPEKLLVIAANILHKAFYDCTRLEAKRRYQFLHDGRTIFLVKLRMDDGSELEVNLNLERSELRGKLNFSLFKQLVGQLLAAYAKTLNEKQPLNTFADDNQQRWVYLIPALSKSSAEPASTESLNMLVLAANMSRPGALTLELMFIDPEQFRRDTAAAG